MPRRVASLTQAERKKLEQFAALKSVAVSALGREWLESYAKNGVPLEPRSYEEFYKLQIVASPELIEAVEKRLEEDGLILSDVIRWEIMQLDQL